MAKENLGGIGDVAGLDARSVTRLRVLNCIRNAGSASRTDISESLRLSPATVTFVTSGLMSGSLIEETAAEETSEGSRRGRPRVALRVAPGNYYVAGLKVARDGISVLILDFDGTEIAKRTVPIAQPQMSALMLVKAIHDAVLVACNGLPGGISRLAGITVGLAGQIDAKARFVHWSSSLTSRNIDLAPLLDAHLPCPTFIDNDANLVAKAEQLFGEAQGLNNFLVVTVEHGVGLGIVLDGKLYRGDRGCGAEFGHTKVALEGALCQCGQHGCLEAYVGTYALLREAGAALPNDSPSTVWSLVELASKGNREAQVILDRAGRMFGMGLSNLINLFDPQRIILSGAAHRIAHLHSDAVLEQVKNSVVKVDVPLPDIRVHNWADEMWARGAAALGIEQISALKVKAIDKHAA